MPLRESRGAQRFPALPLASRDYALHSEAGQTHPSRGQPLKTGCYTPHSAFLEAFFMLKRDVSEARGRRISTLRRLATLASAAAFACACIAASPAVFAQAFPAKPARLIVPFPPGGPLDAVGRLLAQQLSERWGQSVVVENKPGAGGNIGADLVAKSPPDGYTVVMGALSTHAVNPSLYAKMPYDAQKDFAPITRVAITPNVLVVNSALPATSVKELIAFAKAHPGQLSFGS